MRQLSRSWAQGLTFGTFVRGMDVRAIGMFWPEALGTSSLCLGELTSAGHRLYSVRRANLYSVLGSGCDWAIRIRRGQYEEVRAGVRSSWRSTTGSAVDTELDEN